MTIGLQTISIIEPDVARQEGAHGQAAGIPGKEARRKEEATS